MCSTIVDWNSMNKKRYLHGNGEKLKNRLHFLLQFLCCCLFWACLHVGCWYALVFFCSCSRPCQRRKGKEEKEIQRLCHLCLSMTTAYKSHKEKNWETITRTKQHFYFCGKIEGRIKKQSADLYRTMACLPNNNRKSDVTKIWRITKPKCPVG